MPAGTRTRSARPKKLSKEQRLQRELQGTLKDMEGLRIHNIRLSVALRVASSALRGEGKSSLADQLQKYESPYYP